MEYAKVWMIIIICLKITLNTIGELKAAQGTSRKHAGCSQLGEKRQTLSLPPTCTQLVLCEKGKFSLDGSFSKNAPYKQKIIFHLTSIGKMSKKNIFFSLDGRAVVLKMLHAIYKWHMFQKSNFPSLTCVADALTVFPIFLSTFQYRN